VIPQTPIAEAGSEILDDTPFEQMASPQKSGRHDLLGCIRNVEALDIEPNVSLQSDDLDTLIQHELNLDDDPYETGLDLKESLKKPILCAGTQRFFRGTAEA